MTLRARLLAAIALSSATLLVAAACGPGFLDDLTRGTTGPGGPDGDRMPVDAGSCSREVPPGVADAADTAEIPEIYFAFEELKIDTSPSADGGIDPPRGFDLDGLCTCHPSAGACVARAPAPDGANCDLSGGRDNALGVLFDELRGNVPQASADFATVKIQQGIFTVLVDLKGWNGTPDDPRVTVTVYGSQGIDRTDGGAPVPKFDGTDVWTIDPASLQGGADKMGADCRIDLSFCLPVSTRVSAVGQAYVAGGILVASFASVPLAIATNVGNIVFDLDAPALVAKLGTDDAGRHRMVGQIIGRWPTQRALPAIGALAFPVGNGTNLVPLCKNPVYYQGLKLGVCTQADLPSQLDGAASEPCGAISSALAFSAAAEARPSYVYQRTDGGGPCATFTDSCLP